MTGPDEILVRVDAPRTQKEPGFCAGIVMRGGAVVEAAPILAWTKGRTRISLKAYFAAKGWRAVIVKDKNRGIWP